MPNGQIICCKLDDELSYPCEEADNHLGGYHPVGLSLVRAEGTLVRKLTNGSGEFLDFPGVIPGNWSKEPAGPLCRKTWFRAWITAKGNGRYRFAWIVQPDGAVPGGRG